MQIHAYARRGDLVGVAKELRAGVHVDARECGDGETPLQQALLAMSAPSGPKADIAMIRLLLERGADPSVTTAKKWAVHRAPSQLAVRHGTPEVLALLESYGAKWRAVDGEGYGPVLLAVYRVPAEPEAGMSMLTYVLSRGVSPDERSVHGETPPGVASRYGKIKAVAALLAAGADPSSLGWGPAFRAGVASAPWGWSAHEVDVACTDRWGRTPFHWAVMADDVESMRILWGRGANPADADSRGYSPVCLAAMSGAVGALAWLLSHGASVLPTDTGVSPLILGVQNNECAAVAMLLAAGASPDERGEFGDLVFSACRSPEMFTVLRPYATPSRLNLTDDTGEFPLKEAADRSDVDLMRLMLDAGADPNFCGTGHTALHSAVAADALASMRLLLERGADPNAEDVDMDRPLRSVRSFEAVDLLVAYGVDPAAFNCVGTPAWRDIADPVLRKYAAPK